MKERGGRVTPQDLYRFVDQRQKARQERWRMLHRQAFQDAEKILRLITEKYHPRRVIQWGSVLHPEQFRDYSDIDFAVEGIPDAETFFRLVGEAESLTRFPLDLVQWEHLEPPFQDLILSKGKVVYECSD
ncbi:MAG: hypothetical protein Kow009_14040 [Spirochaetales bacterium]